MNFDQLTLSAPIMRALTDAGYTTPTPIQAQAIVPAIEGHDILGCASTGTGKTAAFALPLLHKLSESSQDSHKRGPKRPRALILSPTRELATQISESFATYGKHTKLTHTTIFGGVSQFHQERAMRRGVDIVIATPGRLQDLIQQRIVDLSNVQTLILDEADRMLDMGFIKPIQQISALTSPSRQTLLFSATLPKEILRLAHSLLRDPVQITVKPKKEAKPLIDESVYMVSQKKKPALLEYLLTEHRVERAVVFTKTKHGAENVCRDLCRAGFRADAIHGNKRQGQRNRALQGFKDGRTAVLVATDVAARGLDVDNVTHVFNYDLPQEPESYVHRIGRTGRAGAKGIAFAFCARSEKTMLKMIEKIGRYKIPVGDSIPDHITTSDGHDDEPRPSRPARTPRSPHSSRPARKPRGARSQDSSSEYNNQGRPAKKKQHRKGGRPGAPKPDHAMDSAKPFKKRKPKAAGSRTTNHTQDASDTPRSGKRPNTKKHQSRGPSAGPKKKSRFSPGKKKQARAGKGVASSRSRQGPAHS